MMLDALCLKHAWLPAQAGPVAVIFFTHFADLGSWELAQRLVKIIPCLQAGYLPCRPARAPHGPHAKHPLA